MSFAVIILIMTTTEQKKGYFSSLKKSLSKTKSALIGGMDTIMLRSKKIDENLIEELEELLISADMGVKFTLNVLNNLRNDVKEKKIRDNEGIKKFLKENIADMLKERQVAATDLNSDCSQPELCRENEISQINNTAEEIHRTTGNRIPYTVMVVGVNGSGKTTTIGKLAYRYSSNNKKVLLAAGDTFRAAAIEQLKIWAERTGSDIISHQDGADPSAVVFDSMKAAKARKKDVLIIDTAGRLHTNTNLMEQLKKIKRIVSKDMEDAPHEILLVMDATTGQNGLSQAKMFHEALNLTGIVLTKLDSTSKGGIVVQIFDELNIPVKHIGVGEGMEDLKIFDPEEFANAIF